MKFSSEKVAFGRHETFHLRFSWLSKGFSALKKNQHLFEDFDEATIKLGVGKNMVSAIRYWLRAAGVISQETNIPSELGNYIFDPDTGVDPYLEDQGTLWLIHWLIASNTELATSVSWFFNKYHKTRFDQNELRAALSNFLHNEVKRSKRPAATTIKNDISVITRLYGRTQDSEMSEETLDSPLSELGLISELSKSTYTSLFDNRVDLPLEILGFAIIQLMSLTGARIAPISELLNSSEAYVSPGSVFRLTESYFMVKVEQLVSKYPKNFELRETAGLRQLYLLDSITAIEILRSYYNSVLDRAEFVA